jgi:hypothetical protein
VKSTLQEPVSPIPPPIFPLFKVFSPNLRSLCPMDRLKIPSVHCPYSCPRTTLPISLSFIAEIDQIHNLGLVYRNRMFQFTKSDCLVLADKPYSMNFDPFYVAIEILCI